MNLYFIVEGKRTEPKVYRSWIPMIFDGATESSTPENIGNKQFFLVAGHGFPSIFDRIKASIGDINQFSGRFHHLIITLDAEDDIVEDRKSLIFDFIEEIGGCSVPVHVVVANCCIESWFLGNRKIMSPQPNSERLIAFRSWYNVRELDPEIMPEHEMCRNRADTHLKYLKSMLNEKRMRYTKTSPDSVLTKSYLVELISRCSPGVFNPTHLNTFRELIQLPHSIRW